MVYEVARSYKFRARLNRASFLLRDFTVEISLPVSQRKLSSTISPTFLPLEKYFCTLREEHSTTLSFLIFQTNFNSAEFDRCHFGRYVRLDNYLHWFLNVIAKL